MRRGEDGLVWTAGGHGELDPTNADGDERADLEELAADGAAGGIGEIGRLQSQPTGTLDQDVSHRGKPQAKLVGRHSGGRGAVCKKVDLTLLDPILHLAAGAIDILVEIAAVTFGQRRDDKAGVFFAPGPLSFGNDAPLAAWRPTDAARRTRTVADSSNNRNSHGRTVLPGARAADRQWHQYQERSPPAAFYALPGTA